MWRRCVCGRVVCVWRRGERCGSVRVVEVCVCGGGVCGMEVCVYGEGVCVCVWGGGVAGVLPYPE